MYGEKKGFLNDLSSGLTRQEIILYLIDSIFSGFSSIDDDFYEEIEEILVMGDLGINATNNIIEDLKRQVAEKKIKDPQECKKLLMDSIKAQMAVGEAAYDLKTQVCSAGDWCKWSWKDYFCRKTGRKVKRPGKESCACSSRYIPCGSRRTADPVGEPCRGGTDRRTGRC